MTYQLDSADGDQGFPGNLVAQATYRLTEDNRVEISWQAKVDKTCPVNLTNHAYFNLDGDGSTTDALAQKLQLLPITIFRWKVTGSPAEILPTSAALAWIFVRPRPCNRIC